MSPVWWSTPQEYDDGERPELFGEWFVEDGALDDAPVAIAKEEALLQLEAAVNAVGVVVEREHRGVDPSLVDPVEEAAPVFPEREAIARCDLLGVLPLCVETSTPPRPDVRKPAVPAAARAANTHHGSLRYSLPIARGSELGVHDCVL